MAKVSVLLPVYNTNEEHLRDAINSILTQTFKDFELIIANDCSTDKAVEDIIKSYEDERIVYVLNERNLGISKTRNKLLDLAKGEYLAIMDHDDISLPTRFEKQVEYLDNNLDVGVVGCALIEEFPVGRLVKKPVQNDDIKLALMRSCAIIHPTSMIRKSVLVDKGIKYEEKYSPSEDYAMWCRLIPFTNFYNLPEVLFHYRLHETNTSRLQAKKRVDANYAIHSFAEVENPVLYKNFLLRAERVTQINLFGVIPLFAVIKKGYKTKIKLFGAVTIFACKTRYFYL